MQNECSTTHNFPSDSPGHIASLLFDSSLRPSSKTGVLPCCIGLAASHLRPHTLILDDTAEHRGVTAGAAIAGGGALAVISYSIIAAKPATYSTVQFALFDTITQMPSYEPISIDDADTKPALAGHCTCIVMGVLMDIGVVSSQPARAQTTDMGLSVQHEGDTTKDAAKDTECYGDVVD
ncbi:hypothetical protein HYPSUDRAFT_209519 [Hypholoma sublateritium FD-334 SS-4]|uniref:Uncharacterized protein n=1 Tax=Hypholoma sublateritium (strain FD-334 SS-4) TaxID=945553 RepID=A0A0D2LRJ3_HYPSF|nr:hypothetical protein HYPSUDRAFT_209519 [Hypholoma sublateritium FD-334 SS-4]